MRIGYERNEHVYIYLKNTSSFTNVHLLKINPIHRHKLIKMIKFNPYFIFTQKIEKQ